MQIYTCEEANQHSGTLVFLIGQLFSSIPFLFLLSISSSLVFYFLVGLRDDFSLLMYFSLNFFMCLLVNEGLVLLVASICRNIFWSILILVTIHVSSILVRGAEYIYSYRKHAFSYLPQLEYVLRGLVQWSAIVMVLQIFSCILLSLELFLMNFPLFGPFSNLLFFSFNLTKINVVFQMVMMLSAGYFRIRSALPRAVWMYPISYIAFHTYSIQASRFNIISRTCWFNFIAFDL